MQANNALGELAPPGSPDWRGVSITAIPHACPLIRTVGLCA